MAATLSLYNSFITDLGSGVIKLNSDTIKVMLVNGYVFNEAHTQKSDITGELSTANGYTAGGATISGKTWAYDGDDEVTKFDANDVVWTASGGAIGPATGAVIYSDTSTDDKLLAYVDFGDEEEASDLTDFRITFAANGVLAFG